MSGAGAILHPSTLPRLRTSSPLSRSAGEGPGVRAARSAGAGSGVRAALTSPQPPPLPSCGNCIPSIDEFYPLEREAIIRKAPIGCGPEARAPR